MAQEREFLKRILTDPRAKALLKEMKEPAEAEEAAAAYSAIAEKLGLSLPEDQLRAFLSSLESRCRELAEQAEKKALDEEAMDRVPGPRVSPRALLVFQLSAKEDTPCTELYWAI